jgi:hypothetical protein
MPAQSMDLNVYDTEKLKIFFKSRIFFTYRLVDSIDFVFNRAGKLQQDRKLYPESHISLGDMDPR